MKDLQHTPAADRMQLLDSVRLLAAAGVIVSHVTSELYPNNPLWAIGSFSVPFYLFAALYFTVRGFKKDKSRAIGPYLLGRVVKLYLPFLVWNVAYELMYKVKHMDMPMESLPNLLWAATYAHLYFLPLLAGATLFVVLLMRPIQSSVVFRIALTLAMLAGAAICTWYWTLPPLSSNPSPVEQTIFQIHRTLPPAMLAIVFAIWAGTRERAFRVNPKIGLLGCALMMVALAYQIHYDQPMMRALSGFGLILIAFTPLYFPWLKPFAAIGRHSYGIYLSHVAFIRVALTVAKHFDWPHNDVLAIGVGLFAFVGGAILSIVLAQSKWTSWIVGCDVGASPKKSKPISQGAISSPLQTVPQQTPDPLANVQH